MGPDQAPPGDPARLRQLQEELERTQAQFSALSNRLSHDLQGILSNIEQFASLVRDTAHERLAEREARHLGRIVAGARRGEAMVRDLASLCSVVTAPMQRGVVDAGRLARQAFRDLHPEAQERQVRIDFPEEPTPRLSGDPVLARLAMWHLLSNAVKFTRPTRAAHIRITARAHGESCTIAVSDNGVGFEQAYAHRLFAPFERLHHQDEFEATASGSRSSAKSRYATGAPSARNAWRPAARASG